MGIIPYSPEHEQFRSSLRTFLSREVPPNWRRWEKEHKPDRDFWRRAGENGFIGMGVPEEAGGWGGDFLHHVIAAEELGWVEGGASSGPLLQSDIPIFHILNFGTEAQKAQYIPKIARGEIHLTVGMTEPGSGSDMAGMTTKAIRDGDSYVVNGSKIYISGALTADLMILAAKTDPDAGAKGVSLFMVPMDTPGLTVGEPLKKMGMNSGDNAEIFFNDMRIPASSLLGQEGRGFATLMSELPRERILMSVRSLAEAERAFDLTLDFVKNRKAFGQRIFDFQNTQFTLASLKTELTAARALVERSVADAYAGGLDNTTSAMAKLFVSEVQWRVVDACVQLYGGAGYMDDYEISKLFTAARVIRIYGGTSEIMRMSIGRTL